MTGARIGAAGLLIVVDEDEAAVLVLSPRTPRVAEVERDDMSDVVALPNVPFAVVVLGRLRLRTGLSLASWKAFSFVEEVVAARRADVDRLASDIFVGV